MKIYLVVHRENGYVAGCFTTLEHARHFMNARMDDVWNIIERKLHTDWRDA